MESSKEEKPGLVQGNYDFLVSLKQMQMFMIVQQSEAQGCEKYRIVYLQGDRFSGLKSKMGPDGIQEVSNGVLGAP